MSVVDAHEQARNQMTAIQPKISSYMTLAPHSVGVNQPLSVAHETMRKHAGRHLPVLDGGQLVGIVSQRDLYLIESLRDVDPTQVSVEEAMMADVYKVHPDEALETVAAHMAANRLGCAVVMEGNHIAGLFTTTDALMALVDLLRK